MEKESRLMICMLFIRRLLIYLNIVLVCVVDLFHHSLSLWIWFVQPFGRKKNFSMVRSLAHFIKNVTNELRAFYAGYRWCAKGYFLSEYDPRIGASFFASYDEMNRKISQAREKNSNHCK
jgi:hypothetical protein